MRYTIKHIFNTDIDTFWNKLFFDPEYNKTLFEQHLKFTRYRVLELDAQPGRLGASPRRVRAAGRDAGGGQEDVRRYHELHRGRRASIAKTQALHGRGHAQGRRRQDQDHASRCGPSRAATSASSAWPRSTTRSTFSASARSSKASSRKQTRASYDAAADFTNKWIADKGCNSVESGEHACTSSSSWIRPRR